MTISHRILLTLVTCLLTHFPWVGIAQALEAGTEVTLWLESDHAVATSPFSGRREIRLDAQERVIGSGTNGINGIVVTSRRLLGFSSRSLAWNKIDLDLNEKVVERKILAAFSLVRTDRNLYAFRGANGVWFEDALGVREQVTRFHSNDYGAVFITKERVIGFTPLLGSFSSKPLDIHEQIVEIQNDNGLILVSTTKRTLVLGSQLSGWEEFE